MHVLVLPYAAQGHVIPMMELSQCLAKQGFKVTFVNTDLNHKLVMSSLRDDIGDMINMVSIPDGVEPHEDRNDLGLLTRSMYRVMPGKLEELIEEINGSDEDKITCVIVDACMGWATGVAVKMGIRRALFWPASAATLATIFSIQKLTEDGIIDNHGSPIKNQTIQLSPSMPGMETRNLSWTCIDDFEVQKALFMVVVTANQSEKETDWIICNSTNELEPAAFALFPKVLPIGPFLASNRLAKQAGHFWPEDSTCLEWLDLHPAESVIYVAFGSFTIFNPIQFQELALGLELSSRPFLWVVRPGMTEETNSYPKGFKERIGSRGRIVSWAPQQNVLSHPSVACFISHCGWNSTMEGVTHGTPFLCWPYFCDQFQNERYICDVWKNGLGFEKDESGIITQAEIKNKVDQLLSDKTYKVRALELKEKALSSVRKGGSSEKNFSNFIDWLKEKDAHADEHRDL